MSVSYLIVSECGLGAKGSEVGRTIPSWRMVAVYETERLRKFREFLRSEDKLVFTLSVDDTPRGT